MKTELTVPAVHELLHAYGRRVERAADFFGADIPDYLETPTGPWKVNGGWTEGFWPGLLWRLQAETGSERLKGHAHRTTCQVAARHAETDDHDLGFVFLTSCVLEHELTGEAARLPAALAAAKRLAARYRGDGRYIPAHGPIDGPEAGFAIIDTVMNLPLLNWAAELTGQEELAAIAKNTAATIAREHVRANGSSCQVLRLDPATGRTLRREAVMAATVDSCWARGQAWGVHGFARMAQLLRHPEFQAVSETMADYFLSRLPEDGLVFHDLDDPARPAVPRDTSAQAIAAVGMLILAEMGAGPDRQRWCAAAERLVVPMLKQCLVETGPVAHPPRGLLGQACKSLRKQQGIVCEMVFADYYLVEALQRWRRLNAPAVPGVR
ncbi:MAG: glycoside hydrolase family 88 protein [Opitutaceae bacterium]